VNADHLYAFYGSLRKGMSNYRVYRHGLEYQFTEVLPGYGLHAMQGYPYAVNTNNEKDTIVVEVFRVSDPIVEKDIHDLELGVGYKYEEVLIRGTTTGIYLFEKQGGEPSVRDGDWVKFFGSR